MSLNVITAAGVVSCGGPKITPRVSSMWQNICIYLFWSFETSNNICSILQIFNTLRIFRDFDYFVPFGHTSLSS